MTEIFNDTFTEGTDTNLTSHTPDTGTSWAEQINTSTGPLVPFVQASDDEVYPGGNSVSSAIFDKISPAPTGADGTLTVDLAGSGSGSDDLQGGVMRFVDSSNYLAFGGKFNTANPDFELFEAVSGTVTALSSHDLDHGGGPMRLVLSGATALLSHDFDNDGTFSQVGSVSVTGTLAGDAGIFWGNLGDSAIDDIRSTNSLDNFVYEDDGAASGRIMSSLAASGGLAGLGGIAGRGGGLAG